MGVLDTTYTFTATDVVTSAKLNNVIDQTTFTSSAVIGATLAVTSGQLKVNSLGIGANELADNSVTTVKILDGSVTSGKLAAGAALPAGAVMPFAMATAPTGWFSCDGALLSRTTYALLFAAIGTTFGVGDGSTTFAIPDLRGRFVRSTGTDGTAIALALGVKQGHMFQDHGHSSSATSDSAGNHVHGLPISATEGNTTNQFAQGNVTYIGDQNTYAAGAHTHTINVSVSGASSGTTGTETRPYNMALNYCIKY